MCINIYIDICIYIYICLCTMSYPKQFARLLLIQALSNFTRV